MKLLVKDLFRFSDGRTVFAVLPDKPTQLIEPGLYDLVIEGQSIDSIRIEGEDMICGGEPTELRSVSTRDSEKLMVHTFRSGAWELRK
jgi:hypothetical protein